MIPERVRNPDVERESARVYGEWWAAYLAASDAAWFAAQHSEDVRAAELNQPPRVVSVMEALRGCYYLHDIPYWPGEDVPKITPISRNVVSKVTPSVSEIAQAVSNIPLTGQETPNIETDGINETPPRGRGRPASGLTPAQRKAGQRARQRS